MPRRVQPMDIFDEPSGPSFEPIAMRDNRAAMLESLHHDISRLRLDVGLPSQRLPVGPASRARMPVFASVSTFAFGRGEQVRPAATAHNSPAAPIGAPATQQAKERFGEPTGLAPCPVLNEAAASGYGLAQTQEGRDSIRAVLEILPTPAERAAALKAAQEAAAARKAADEAAARKAAEAETARKAAEEAARKAAEEETARKAADEAAAAEEVARKAAEEAARKAAEEAALKAAEEETARKAAEAARALSGR